MVVGLVGEDVGGGGEVGGIDMDAFRGYAEFLKIRLIGGKVGAGCGNDDGLVPEKRKIVRDVARASAKILLDAFDAETYVDVVKFVL